MPEHNNVNFGPVGTLDYCEVVGPNKVANAKLIAAAPELLNVLIDARELLKDWGIDEEAAGHALLYRIESAIKKATE